MRPTTTRALLLLACLAAAASGDTSGLAAVSGGSLGLAAEALDPVTDAASSGTDSELRSKRLAGSARPSAAQRWYSMLRGMAGGDGLQPFWLSFGGMMVDGIAEKKRGENGVLVLPVPVAVPKEEYVENFEQEPQAEEWVAPVWSSGSSGSGERRPPIQRPMRRPLAARPLAPRPSMLRDYEPAYTPVSPVSLVNPDRGTPPPPPYDEELLMEPPPVESSRDLVKQFRQQIDSIPYEYDDPPEETVLEPFVESEKSVAVVVRRRRLGLDDVGAQLTPGSPPTERRGRVPREAPPPPLHFDRPLALRGEVYVRTARYKEPFTVWERADGATRTELQGGAATAFRVPLPDGRMQLKLIQVERSSGREVWRCAETPPFPAGSDKALQRHPALPDVSQFTYAGYVRRGQMRAEMWRWEQTGEAGKLGAAPNEVLTFHHELLVMREANASTTPLKYTMKVASSVLGANSDGHEVRYSTVTSPAPAFDLDSARCDITDTLSPTNAEHLARLEPLREFTGAARDPRYDAIIAEFKSGNSRKYVDPAEEAVRKNLVMQNSRFVTSINRAGETFALGTNFLSDRLDVEREKLNGVKVDVSTLPASPFPYSDKELSDLAKDLPLEFDWREHNAVTPVRFQGMTCASCWAFAVSGAVEGARFIHTKELHALSEQSLVDCAKPYVGGGCRGTWPEHAYEYVNARGLPALTNYTPYNGTVMECRDAGRALPGTRISGFVNVPPNNIDALKVAIRLHAPVVVLVDTSPQNFTNYKTGAMRATNCKQTKLYLKHAMLAVGWDNEDGNTNLIIKNSWSSKWGNKGYIKMLASGNTCGVLTLPSYPVLGLHDVFDGTSNLE